ncbi:hypothetical protein RhiirA1_476313, partial [Rhizophagus irregularis]
MGNISVKINDDANKIEIKVDKIEVDKNYDDKIFTFNDINDEPHNGRPITMIEISPNEKYLITYSEEDHSIVGWNVEDIDKIQLKFDQTGSLCVSDDKKLAYAYRYNDDKIDIIDMNSKDKKIALSFDKNVCPVYCTFNLKGEFILYSVVKTSCGDFGNRKILWIYSTQTKNNKWECKRFYKIPKYYGMISISKYDKIYLFSNDCIYEWNINTEKSVKIFVNNKDKNEIETRNIGIFSNEKFNILKVNDKIIVYSIEFGITIASLDIDDDIQLYNFMNHTGLFLLPSLFYYTPDKEINYCWFSKYKNKDNKTLPTDKQTKFVFGILNERVWKSKFNENMSETKVVECDDDDKKTYNHLNVHSFNPYMDTVSTLFQNATTNDDNIVKSSTILTRIKWDVHVDDDKIKLEVSKKINTVWEPISTRIENHPYKLYYSFHKLIASSLFNNNVIVILTTFGILIYTFSENNKSISLNYFYFMHLNYYYSDNKKYMKILQHNTKIFSKSTLPLPNYDSFKLNGWVSDIIINKSSLLKYGVELLPFAIKEHKLELIDDIYKKYSSFYSIKQQNKNFHLYSFSQSPQVANLSKSLLWTKYYCKLFEFYYKTKYTNLLIFILLIIYYAIQTLIILLTLPLYLATYYILSKYNIINDIYILDAFSFIYSYTELTIFKIFKKYITTTPIITFMIPYINFVSYSKDYNWFLELIRPQP